MREFTSFADLAAFIASQSSAIERAGSYGLHEAAMVVQEEARHELGEYQGAAGSFQAWAPLADTTLEGFTDQNGHHHPGKIELGFAPPDNPGLRTGTLRDAIEISSTYREAVVGVPDEFVGSGTPEDPARNIGDVAVDFEMGTSRQPARSFLGRAAFVKQHEIVDLVAGAVVSAIAGLPLQHQKPAHATAPDDTIPF